MAKKQSMYTIIKILISVIILYYLISLTLKIYKNLTKKLRKNIELQKKAIDNSTYGSHHNKISPTQESHQDGYAFIPENMSGESMDIPQPADSENVDLMGGSLHIVENLSEQEPDRDYDFKFGDVDGPQVVLSGPSGVFSA
jgi:hypothetical protein